MSKCYEIQNIFEPWNPLSKNLNDNKPNQNSTNMFKPNVSGGSRFSVLFQKIKRCEIHLYIYVFLFQNIVVTN